MSKRPGLQSRNDVLLDIYARNGTFTNRGDVNIFLDGSCFIVERRVDDACRRHTDLLNIHCSIVRDAERMHDISL